MGDTTLMPPHDLYAEAGLLGAIMLDGSGQVLDTASALVHADDFYSGKNRRIYEAATALYAAGQPVDIGSIAGKLHDSGRIAEVGGLPYLRELGEGSFGKTDDRTVRAYSKVVKTKARLRLLIKHCAQIGASAYGDVGDPQEFLERAERSISDIAQSETLSAFVPLHRAAEHVYADAVLRSKSDRKMVGLGTGFGGLDRMINGLRDGTLTVIAARPAVGKSALGVGIALSVAEAYGVDVGIFSIEMSTNELAVRAVCSDSGIHQSRFQSGGLITEEYKTITSFINRSKERIHVHICDDSGITPLSLRARSRKLSRDATKAGRKLGLVVVDYLQLMESGGRRKGDSREQEVSGVSRALKKLAKELNVPVIALAQLSRTSEQRADKRPLMSDLRESGAIEQDADNIVLLHRDMTPQPKDISPIRETEAIVAKARNGSPGVVHLDFDGPTTRFREIQMDANDKL